MLETALEAIIFDLDGTLWDSVDTICEAWNRGMTALGRPANLTREKLSGQMGMTVDQLRAAIFPDVDPAEGLKMIQFLFHIENSLIREQGGRLYPGIRETLMALSRCYRLAIVSNCGLGYIEAFLEHYQLESCFSDCENNGRTGLLKGDNIRLLMERQGIRHALYVGDTQGDCEAARHAGIPFAFASYGFGTVPREACDLVLENFSDLQQLVLPQEA